MSTKEVIEAIAGEMSSNPSFRYGTIDEGNTFNDSITQWPLVFLFAIQQVDLKFGRSYGLTDKTNLNILFADKAEFGIFANETQSIRDAQLSYVKEFLDRMARYEVNGSKYFLIKPGDTVRAVAVYDEFDVNLTGYRLEISVATMQKEEACI